MERRNVYGWEVEVAELKHLQNHEIRVLLGEVHLADRVFVYHGHPGVKATATSPQ